MIEPDRKKKLPETGSLAEGSAPRLQQLFGHFRKVENKIGSWLEDDPAAEASDEKGLQTIETMVGFRARNDLHLVKQLVPDQLDPKVNPVLLAWENLVPFYEAGFLISSPLRQPLIRQFFFRGVRFEIPGEGRPYPRQLPLLGPLEVKKMDGLKWLAHSGFAFLQLDPDSQAFLLQPDPTTSMVLVSAIPLIWRADHVKHTQLLLNNAVDRSHSGVSTK